MTAKSTTPDKTPQPQDNANLKAPTPAVVPADHDRVAMVSWRADGTADQTKPEMIGDKDAALAATTTQLRERAVSAADQALVQTAAVDGGAVGEDSPEDPDIEKAKEAHEQAAEAGEKSAAKVVEQLHEG